MTQPDHLATTAIRCARDNALRAAIEICEEMVRAGHDIEACIQALRDLKALLPPAPKAMQ